MDQRIQGRGQSMSAIPVTGRDRGMLREPGSEAHFDMLNRDIRCFS